MISGAWTTSEDALSRNFRARFHCIDAHVPEETIRLLRESCVSRNVEFVHVEAEAFDYEPYRQANPGEMLYRAGISAAAGFVEQHLYRRGVATFHASDDGPMVLRVNPLLAFQRARLPVPRWVHVTVATRDRLKQYVERLGGLPVVLKFSGFSRGVGVTRIDSMGGLFSAIDYALEIGRIPVMCSFVDNATHWRAVVVGDRMVSHYRNVMDEDDFRTSASDRVEDFVVPAPGGLSEIAVGAVRALGAEFGGVDILEHPSGRLYLLESNNPCYFASAQLTIGTDVSGAMVDHLLTKAETLMDRAQVV